jgi:hypothetical protein
LYAYNYSIALTYEKQMSKEGLHDTTFIEESTIEKPLIENSATEEDANASVGSSIINMTNNVMGSGLVALAYAVSRVRICL